MTEVDQYRIDSHKLHLHPQRVAEWDASGDAYPIYMEVSPVGACNHRCTFCGVDFMGYQNRRLELAVFERLLPELGKLGLKSIMFAGEGEPLLHPDIAAITAATKTAGIDVSFTTNATLLKPALAEKLLPLTSWIKTSINAGTAATYAKIHRTKEADFDRVLANMSAAVDLKRRNGWRCTLGLQAVLLPENWDEMEILAQTARDIGLDYLVVKPYSQHTQGIQDAYAGMRYDAANALAERLATYATATFKPLVRLNTMRKWDEGQRPYQRCLALPFWSYIDAGGEVWGCSIYMKDERFRYGNVTTQSFQEIWQGELRRRSQDFVHNRLDISGCRVNCRMDEINRYLWELKHPQDHANFI